MSEKKIKNPILPGFYPDPSICRVGGDYYMVCSSFEMYPGIPVFHSRDLANWEQIGYVMTMENDFHVEAGYFAGGVMAPTIRHHDGTFYIINANFSDKGNYIVTAKNPAGPWSKPSYLTDVPGIDASLFFDEDGLAYVVGTGNVVTRRDGSLERGIWVSEFDLKTMKTKGECSVIWDSALRGAASPESPHIYKVGEYYYLIIAEGGTEHYHAVTVARSKILRGWYEGNPANPVMTHRQFGFSCPIANVGHADLTDTLNGNWYAVLLGSRTIEGYYKNLGRETYICPVVWERGWPVFSPVSGKIDWEYHADESLPWTEWEQEPDCDDFNEPMLKLAWNFWGTPYQDFWHIENSRLYLRCLPRRLSEPLEPVNFEEKERVKDKCVSFLGRRQIHMDFEALCSMEFQPKAGETAGFVVMQASNHQYRLESALKDNRQVLRLLLVTSSFEVPPYMPGFSSETEEKVLAELSWEQKTVVIGLRARGQRYDFCYGEDMENLLPLYVGADGRAVNPEIVGGMVGTLLGMFASGNGDDSLNQAAFDWFIYRELN